MMFASLVLMANYQGLEVGKRCAPHPGYRAPRHAYPFASPLRAPPCTAVHRGFMRQASTTRLPMHAFLLGFRYSLQAFDLRLQFRDFLVALSEGFLRQLCDPLEQCVPVHELAKGLDPLLT
jgi:hypothetical protein